MIKTIRPLNFIEKIRKDGNLVSDIRFSDVILCNQFEGCTCAVGLVYDTRVSPVPHVTCGGVGRIATQIQNIAKANDMVMFENPELTEILYSWCRDGEPVLPSYYRPVARILAHAYAEELKKRGK